MRKNIRRTILEFKQKANMRTVIYVINKNKLLFQNFLIAYCFYSIFLMEQHFSTDTYNNYVGNELSFMIQLEHGRFITAGLYKLFNVVGFDYGKHSLFGQFLLIVMCSWCVTWICDQFLCLFEDCTVLQKWLVDVLLLICWLNISVMELFLFPDIGYSIALVYLCTGCAVAFWCRKNRSSRDVLFSFLMLCLALDQYQIMLGVYVILGTTYVLIENKIRFTKKMILDEAILIVLSLVAALQSVLLMKLPEKLHITYSEKYVAKLTSAKVQDNILEIMRQQKSIWFGLDGFLPKCLPISFAIICVIILLFCMWKSRRPLLSYMLIILALLGSWFMIFATYTIAQVVWMPPRTIISLFAFLVLPGILIARFGKVQYHLFVMMLSLFFLMVMHVQVQKVAINNMANNRVDEARCHIIVEEIKEYERQTGNEINTIAIHRDEKLTYGNPGIDYVIRDTNVTAFAQSWSDVACIEYYSGRPYMRRDMTEQEYVNYFPMKDWNYLNVEEQLRFEKNTLFMIIY